MGLTYLVVLIGSDSNEFGLWKHICPESAVGKLQNIVGPHNMEPRLVFVHGVQYSLRTKQKNGVRLKTGFFPDNPNIGQTIN